MSADPLNLHSFVIPLARTGPAKHAPVAQNFAAEVDAFAAFGAHYAFAFVSGKFFRGEFDLHPLLRE